MSRKLVIPDDISEQNELLLSLVSEYLNQRADYINAESMKSLSEVAPLLPKETCFSLLMAAAMGLCIDTDMSHRMFYEAYFPRMICIAERDTYRADPYYRFIHIPDAAFGPWQLCRKRVEPYEAFVLDDMSLESDGRIIPHIGFFERPLVCPAVLEHGREWMSITPNEINTMKAAIEACTGNVLTFGLGLGYFAYMASIRREVRSVTVVEKDSRIISLFERHILPLFCERAKIRVVQGDAFDFAQSAMPQGNYDLVFTDLWHDAGDAQALYLRMRSIADAHPGPRYMYWIEKTIALYLI